MIIRPIYSLSNMKIGLRFRFGVGADWIIVRLRRMRIVSERSTCLQAVTRIRIAKAMHMISGFIEAVYFGRSAYFGAFYSYKGNQLTI